MNIVSVKGFIDVVYYHQFILLINFWNDKDNHYIKLQRRDTTVYLICILMSNLEKYFMNSIYNIYRRYTHVEPPIKKWYNKETEQDNEAKIKI